MKKTMLAAVLMFAGWIAATGAAPDLGFNHVYDNLSARNNTTLHVKEYWKEIKGTEVTWAGEAVDVDGGSSKAKIYVADKSRPTYKGYNIIFVTHDIPKAANVKKGQKIRFKGILKDYDQKDAGVVIELSETNIL